VRSIIAFFFFLASLALAQPQSIAVLPSLADKESKITPKQLDDLTKDIYTIATKTLPSKGFAVMRQDMIEEMLGDSAYVADCEDGGSCVGRLIEKIIKSDFGMRCDIYTVDKQLVMYCELYGKPRGESIYRLVDAIKENVKNFAEMQVMVKKRIPAMFLKITKTPRENCEADAGVWIDGVCKTDLQRKQEACDKKGDIWIRGACKPQKQLECEDAGDKWVGDECKSDKQISCESKGNVWANGVCSYPLTDSRDKQKYRTVKIGNQTWMAENLNYNAKGSKCYENSEANCKKYGRLYNWATAMNACPSGWHLPSEAEWDALINSVGGEETAGKHLKAKSGWNDYEGKSGNGIDTYGFAALPGGIGYFDGHFGLVGNYGKLWSSTEVIIIHACYKPLNYDGEHMYPVSQNKSILSSVRCVKD
jgi:uncharacterized protein (TIGR02145 family)